VLGFHRSGHMYTVNQGYYGNTVYQIDTVHQQALVFLEHNNTLTPYDTHCGTVTPCAPLILQCTVAKQ